MNPNLVIVGLIQLCGLSAAVTLNHQRRQTGPVPPGTIADCTYFVTAQTGDTCASISTNWGITQAQFVQYNPSVHSDCSGIVVGDSYCVEENYGKGPATTSTTATSSTTTTTSVTIGGPNPTQSGIASNCQRFYQVKSGDNCVNIVDTFQEFTLQDFYNWNPAVGDQCQSLFAGYYVCVGVPGTPTTPITTPQPITTGVSPTQTGIVSNCVSFYQAKAGDTCDSIAKAYGTFSTSDFESWNPAVGLSCNGLWLGYYYCVGVPGTPTSKPPPTSSSTSTPAGPSPTQSGIVSTCVKYYQAKSGDTCQAISDTYGTFSVANFETWNPAVGSGCTGLWVGYWYCVGVPGTPSTRTTTSSSPTPTLQGPQPQQPGIVKNCNNYYKVASGDSCWSIEQQAHVSADQFFAWNTGLKSDCSNLFLGYYVCVGVK